jgi:hypothetical protein
MRKVRGRLATRRREIGGRQVKSDYEKEERLLASEEGSQRD